MVCLKIAVIAVVLTVVAARPGPPAYGAQAAPSYIAGPAYGIQQEEPYEERNYKVYYSVKDDPSYNYQTRNEEKNGKTVTGQYTVMEPTGELRVVNYIADEYGFRADVQNQPNYGPAAPAAPAASYGRAPAAPHAAPAAYRPVSAPSRPY